MRDRPRFPRGFQLPWRSAGEIRDEVEEEVAFHLEMRAAELAEGGMPPEEASRAARREFGDVEEAKRALREGDLRGERGRRRSEWLAELGQDAAAAGRQLARRPAFALLAAGTLAAGIGAATTTFSLADHVLLRPLPYLGVERAVTLWETEAAAGAGAGAGEVSPGNYLDWAERASAFSELALAEPYGFDLTGSGRPEPVDAWLVTERYFAAVGAPPLLGRAFNAADYDAGAEPAVLLSERIWRSRYGSDAGIVGRRIELNGAPATVVGVMPAWLEYPGRAEIWAPKRFLERERTDRESGYMRVVGRLRPGVGLPAARADLDRVAAQLAAEHPTSNARAGIELVPLAEQILGDVRPALLVLLGAVGLLLLVVCANVAGLLLARGVERTHEMGVRRALGAGRGRLIRQLLTESAVLAGAGGVAGIALARLGVEAVGALSPAGLPRLDQVAMDGRILAFALGVTLLTALVFGAAPALRLSRVTPQWTLRAGSGQSAGRDRGRFRAMLVIGELALATVLLVGAGLLARSFDRLTANEPGFAVDGRATVQLFLWDRNPTREQREQRVGEMLASLEAVPGVEEAAVVTAFPFHPQQIAAQDVFTVEGEPPVADPRRSFTTAASPEYFAAMRIPVRSGRSFTAADRADAPEVAVVNETFARRFFPGEDPLGKRIRIGVMSAPRLREIVGVVADVRPETLDGDPRPELFIPYAQSGTGSVTFVVETRGDPAPLLPALKEAIWSVDGDQTIDHTATARSLVSDTLAERRFHLALLGGFSLAALALAALGVYGLISFTTRQRRREIGIRLALGAAPRRVVAMIVREGVRLGVPGVAIGLVAAALLTGSMWGMLYGVDPVDPLTFAQLAVILLVVAALGAYLPARRATRVDPARSLRAD